MKRLTVLVTSAALSGCAIEYIPEKTSSPGSYAFKKDTISYYRDDDLNYESISIAGVRYADLGRDGSVDFVTLPDGTTKTHFSRDEKEVNDTLFKIIKKELFPKESHTK